MIPSGTAWFTQIGRLGFLAKALILVGALLVLAIPTSAIAYAAYGNSGLMAALLAGGVCLAAGVNGLAISALFASRPTADAFAGVMAGMLVRMGLPLILMLVLVVKSHPCLESGFAWYLVAFYQVMLFIELLLCLPREDASQSVVIQQHPAQQHGMNRHGG